MTNKIIAGRTPERLKNPSTRVLDEASALIARLTQEVEHCLQEACARRPGEEGYTELRSAELDHAVKLGKVSAKILAGVGRLDGRTKHEIVVTRRDAQPLPSGDVLFSEYRKSLADNRSSLPQYTDLPDEDLARIEAVLEEKEMQFTSVDLETEEFGELAERHWKWTLDRAERRRKIMHERDRARITDQELYYLKKEEFAQRLEVYAFTRMEEERKRREAAEDKDRDVQPLETMG